MASGPRRGGLSRSTSVTRARLGQIVRYIDARLVAERLNLVAGGARTYQLEPLDPALRPPGPGARSTWCAR